MSADFLSAIWPCLIFIGVGGICAFHLIKGLNTGVISFPLSFVVFEEFEREQSAVNFWGVVIADLLLLAASCTVAIYAGVHGL